MSQYQLLLPQKITLLCPIIHLVMTQISTSPVPKNHFVKTHNSSQRDSKSTSPVPKNHLVQSQNLSCFDHKSTSPVPKSDLVLSHISTCHDVILTYPVLKVTLFYPVIRLHITQYHILLSQKSPCLSHNSSRHDPISTSPVPKSHLSLLHHSSCYDLIPTSPSDLVRSCFIIVKIMF
jgi:hypothetical protein